MVPGDPGNVTFVLSFHADNPMGPSGWSEPIDPPLWTYTFAPGSYYYEVYMFGLDEGFLFPPDDYTPSADTMCWMYTFPIPEGEEFIQEGSELEPVVYWLDVQAFPEEEAYFGWKTSVRHWNDDAVWAEGDDIAHGPWQ